MILIADSGSTKTSWCLTNNGGIIKYFHTEGINPFFRTSVDIVEELQQNLMSEIDVEIQQIFFYGAGIINQQKANIIKIALSQLFQKANIEIQSDLFAAARSTLGNQEGIACILGTGSNSCLYNGSEIIANNPPLGFILGDEGSGAVLGKKLLADYLKGIMPEKISSRFQTRFQLTYAEFMEGVYKQEKPNRFLAEFVPFLAENISENYCSTLVINSFEEFVKRNVLLYSDYKQHQICFVGSVAFHFHKQLEKVMEKYHLQLKSVAKEPMPGLLKFHTNNQI